MMLKGGHPNSLGRTIEVVDTVLADPRRLEELYDCYFSTDEVVRLRTSNAMKRIANERPDWLVPYIDRFVHDIASINQASTQWTLANLFQTLAARMTPEQRSGALTILKRNLESHDDWIVLNNTMQTLAEWANSDTELRQWLLPHLKRLSSDRRKSVAGRARKLYAALS
jgi:hypothetical protein